MLRIMSLPRSRSASKSLCRAIVTAPRLQRPSTRLRLSAGLSCSGTHRGRGESHRSPAPYPPSSAAQLLKAWWLEARLAHQFSCSSLTTRHQAGGAWTGRTIKVDCGGIKRLNETKLRVLCVSAVVSFGWRPCRAVLLSPRFLFFLRG